MVAKRFWICLVCGLVAGLICGWMGTTRLPEGVSASMVFWSSFLNRAFIGFVLGISAWRMGWALHGIVIGFLGSLPLAFPLLFTPQAGFNPFFAYLVAGIVWGFLIELVASVIFKAKMTSVAAAPVAAAPQPQPFPPTPEPSFEAQQTQSQTE